MLIHPEPDKRKSIEQRIKGLICRQLLFRVDEEQIFIDKEDFVDLLYLDIIALAKADCEIETALEIAIAQQPHYSQIRESKVQVLQETQTLYMIEINAYMEYLECTKDGLEDDEIYEMVLETLSADEDILHDKMEEMLFYHFSQLQPIVEVGQDTLELLLLRLVRGVKLMAITNSLEEALELAESENKQLQLNRELLEKIPTLEKELSAYKMAMSMYEQGSEICIALEIAKKILT